MHSQGAVGGGGGLTSNRADCYHGEVEQATLGFPNGRKVWTVAGLLASVKLGLEREYFDVWIEGEISNFHRAASKHCYFTLKDGQAQLRAALFAPKARHLNCELRDGMQVRVRGRISVYEARGDLQCSVEWVEPLGRGALQAAFEALKLKLADEGLFAQERKRPLPKLPRRVGLITSARGAAVADIVHVLRRRFANIEILLYPVAVQGEAAAGEIIAALEFFAGPGAGRADVLIVGRGGGSLEDLWPFNDEGVARALARSPVPTISAVGHETDFTIADFVADVRAPTPSAAAELVIASRAELERQQSALRRHLEQAMLLLLLRRRNQLDGLARHRALQQVRDRAYQFGQRLDEINRSLEATIGRRLQIRRRRLDAAGRAIGHLDPRRQITSAQAGLAARRERLASVARGQFAMRRQRLQHAADLLKERNPLRLLERGYTLTYDASGALATGPECFDPGDAVRVRFAQGWLDAEAKGKGIEGKG